MKRSVTAETGTDLLSAAVAAGIPIASHCGGEGLCGRCRVRIVSGRFGFDGEGVLPPEDRGSGVHLACRSRIGSDAVVEVMPESLLAEENILTGGAGGLRRAMGEPGDVSLCADLDEMTKFPLDPLARKVHLKLPRPTLDDPVCDEHRVERALKAALRVPRARLTMADIRRLGRFLRDADFDITATVCVRDGVAEVRRIEAGDTSARHYGLAVDVGTTTVVVQVVDMASGRSLAAKAAANAQRRYGEDVITRIQHAGKPGGLDELADAVLGTIRHLALAATSEAGVSLEDVSVVVCAGNPTMTHLLLRIDPTFLRREPYAAVTNSPPILFAHEVGLGLHPRARVACVPGISAYVGGDVVGGVVATGMAESPDLSLLIDLGTNGEIALGNREWLVACSASAGPAFEGCGVTCGMRATAGAVQRVALDGRGRVLSVETIGNAAPAGICGSGYIDLLGELLRTGVIDRAGNFVRGHPAVRGPEDDPRFVVADARDAAGGRDIVISQTDIKTLINSKAAIFAGASVLMSRMGVSRADLKHVYLAGGFGSTLDVGKAVAIGMLPDVPLDRIHFVGNSSLGGAKKALLSERAWRLAHEVAGRMTYFELSTDNRFMEEFVASMFLPHTDMDRFPSAAGGGRVR
ncbi:MAG: ASKHA domain-containing protein [Planctomycetota bacterium]|nr:ASKHA domain-containing protein [Planctomycetota bacterium]